MEASIFSKSSWHWHLAHTYGSAELDDLYDEHDNLIGSGYRGDICDYIQCMAKGSLLVLLCIAGLSLMLSPVVGFFVWLTFIFNNGFIEPDILTIVFFSLCVCAVIVGVATFGKIKYDNRVRVERQQPTITSEVYRKFKTKTCFRVIVK